MVSIQGNGLVEVEDRGSNHRIGCQSGGGKLGVVRLFAYLEQLPDSLWVLGKDFLVMQKVFLQESELPARWRAAQDCLEGIGDAFLFVCQVRLFQDPLGQVAGGLHKGDVVHQGKGLQGGDGLILANECFHSYPNDDEGQLSMRLHALARQSALVEIAHEIDLAPLIRAQPGMDVSRNKSILSDVVESLIAALYLDAGIHAAETFVLRYWSFETGPISHREKDAKSRLQEAAMQHGLNLPKYRLVERTGPDHAPQMTYEVQLAGMVPVTATAGNRKEAEQQAATMLLEQITASPRQERERWDHEC